MSGDTWLLLENQVVEGINTVVNVVQSAIQNDEMDGLSAVQEVIQGIQFINTVKQCNQHCQPK